MKAITLIIFVLLSITTINAQGKYFGGVGSGYSSTFLDGLTSQEEGKLNKNTIAIFPSIIVDDLNIHQQNNNEIRLSIIQADGKTLLHSTLKNKENRLSLKNLETGFYFVQIIDEEQTIVEKIFIR